MKHLAATVLVVVAVGCPPAAGEDDARVEVASAAEPCLNLRAAPSAAAERRDCLEPGTSGRVLESKPGWTRLRLPGGKEGWVSSRWIIWVRPPGTGMKRIIGFGIVAALLLALPAAHTALAKGHKPDPKVHICHITGEGVRADGTELWVGHVIEISENALAAHCAHGVGDHNPNAMGPVGSLCGRAKTANVPCTGLIY